MHFTHRLKSILSGKNKVREKRTQGIARESLKENDIDKIKIKTKKKPEKKKPNIKLLKNINVIIYLHCKFYLIES